MAQTKKKRRRKHRGTQGGKIDTRPTKPRNRAEAKARAKTRRSGGGGGSKKARQRPAAGVGSRQLDPPSWSGAFKKGGLAALFFFVLIAFVFGRGAANAVGISALMLLFYIPMSYYVDTFFFNRQLRKQQQERAKQQQGD